MFGNLFFMYTNLTLINVKFRLRGLTHLTPTTTYGESTPQFWMSQATTTTILRFEDLCVF